MAETAVGLFEHPGTADAVVDALRASGFPANGIRTLSKPAAMPVDSATSTPALDFAAALSQDLLAMGASEPECQAYLDGLRLGNVLVFATGSVAEAETAIAVMDAYDPIEIEEFAGSAPALPGIHFGNAGAHDISSKIDRSRAKSEGARVFSW